MMLEARDYAALKRLQFIGPTTKLDHGISGRLALYRLIVETPVGWTITAAGRAALRTAKTRPKVKERRKPIRDPAAPRNYKRRSRDMSWVD